jgi:uncharacterized repeat protein (TIGR01451 family)
MRRTRLSATLGAVVVAACALGPMGGAGAVIKTGFPEFEKCLKQSGLATVPSDQSAHQVQICKTVRATKVTVFSWALAKTPAPPSLLLATSQAGPLAYTLTATPTPTVTWIVDGDVVVRNTGPENATVLKVVDELTLPDGSKLSDVLAGDSFVLSGQPSTTPVERVLHYSFTVPAAAAQGANAASNRAAADWEIGGKVDPTSTVSLGVSFVEGPKTPTAVYFRNATVADYIDAAPPGVAIAAGPSGPFPLAADQPASLNPVVSAQVTNVSLHCGSTGTITDVAALQSDSAPERKNNPALLRPAPLPQTVAARALVLVMSPDCGPAPPLSTPQTVAPTPTIAGTPTPPAPLPGVTPAGTPIPVPRKPPKPPACPLPRLDASMIGPRRAFTGQRASWLITVNNRGSAAARNLVVREQLPVGFSVVGSTRSFAFAGRLLRFPVKRLAGGRRLAIRITMQVDNGLAAGTAVHRVRVSASCGAAETALAPVRVTPGVAPAVTG